MYQNTDGFCPYPFCCFLGLTARSISPSCICVLLCSCHYNYDIFAPYPRPLDTIPMRTINVASFFYIVSSSFTLSNSQSVAQNSTTSPTVTQSITRTVSQSDVQAMAMATTFQNCSQGASVSCTFSESQSVSPTQTFTPTAMSQSLVPSISQTGGTTIINVSSLCIHAFCLLACTNCLRVFSSSISLSSSAEALQWM